VFGLHARKISFSHPGTKQPLDLVAEPPDAWKPFVERFERTKLR